MYSKPLLFVTVAAPYTIVQAAYDVEALNLYADYVQVGLKISFRERVFKNSRTTPSTGWAKKKFARPCVPTK